MKDIIIDFLVKNGLIVSFAVVACIIISSTFLSRYIFNKKIPSSAIAIISGLILAYMGGWSGGTKGIADVAVFSGFTILGGSMFRDFAVVATASGASFTEIKKAGLIGAISLLIGVLGSFLLGLLIGYGFGYTDAKSLTTIGAGACSFIVGPITGSAINADSDVIAISIATGVMKSIFVTITTPIIAKLIGLDNPSSAMVFGGLAGTTSGVAAGLAATDPKLVPYGAVTATFYTGLGCLFCPSIGYALTRLFMD